MFFSTTSAVLFSERILSSTRNKSASAYVKFQQNEQGWLKLHQRFRGLFAQRCDLVLQRGRALFFSLVFVATGFLLFLVGFCPHAEFILETPCWNSRCHAWIRKRSSTLLVLDYRKSIRLRVTKQAARRE